MKADTMGISTQINKKEMKELTKETKEVISIDAKTDENNRSFGSIDLWNVRKKSRTSASMSRWLN
jgi:hypothetical protein